MISTTHCSATRFRITHLTLTAAPMRRTKAFGRARAPAGARSCYRPAALKIARYRAVQRLRQGGTVLPNSTVLPYYYTLMEEELLLRFRRAYWQVFREVDTLRLQQWERSRVTLPQLRVLSFLRRNPGATTKALSRSLGITV